LHDYDITYIARCLYEASRLACIAPLDGVFSFTELGLETAGVIAAGLGINGTELGPNVKTRNKDITRELIVGTALGNVRFALCRSHEDLLLAAKRLGLPAIKKPLNGKGSEGIQKIGSLADLPHIDLGTSGALVEQLITGPEYSVETISHRGEHTAIAVTQKSINRDFIETQHLLPAPIPANQTALLIERTKLLLDRIQLSTGLSHTEFILSREEDGSLDAHLIETQLRPGGDRIWKLVELCFGMKLDKTNIAQSLGLPAPINSKPNRFALSCFPEFEPGRIVRIEGIDDVRKSPGVFSFECDYKIGDIVDRWKSSADRKCCLVAFGDTAEELESRKRIALSKFVLETMVDIAGGHD